MAERWRTGRTVGRTIYTHHGDDPNGQLIGLMDTPELAALVCAAVNAKLAPPSASQADRGPHSTGDDAGAAHDGDGGSAALSALRDRIRDAFHTINPNCVAYHATDCTDCTTRADAIMSDQPPANELLTAPKSPANDLRQRIAAALNQAFAYVTASGQGTTTGFVAWTDFADAVMAEVQPELADKDAEIDRLRTQSCPGCMAREQERDAWAEAARQTGVKSVEYKRSIEAWRQRAEAAEERLNDIREEGRDI